MSEIVERVRKAIADTLDKTGDWEATARAAIEAMRDATDDMKQAGFAASPHDVGGCRDQIASDEEWMVHAVIEPWEAMIDAALQPPLDVACEHPHKA